MSSKEMRTIVREIIEAQMDMADILRGIVGEDKSDKAELDKVDRSLRRASTLLNQVDLGVLDTLSSGTTPHPVAEIERMVSEGGPAKS